MCGIAGLIGYDPMRPADGESVRRMCDALAHRGPDDAGVHVDGPVALGHRRLSILDLSAAGHQPMGNADGSVWISFNGEIYNFAGLREELEREGHRFRSRTDTEVLLRLYESRGLDAVQALRGMFAFAIWDRPRRRLVRARDRLGVKPLYYHEDARGLRFASELKAILADPSVRREVDPVALHHYLTYQVVPAPWTAFRGIRKLPPGHLLVRESGRTTITRWWRLEYGPKRVVRGARALRDLETELLDRLDEAVRLRMVSDVPLGAFLSGGIDSSAVVASMARQQQAPVRTFSIGFDERGYDELPAARAVAAHHRTRHLEYRVRPSALDVLPELTWLYDEPFSDASSIPTWHVSRLAREPVTVVLNGDAGDEAFAGYDRHRANLYAERLARLMPLLASPRLRGLLRALPHGSDPHDPRWRLKRFLEHAAEPATVRNGRWLSLFDTERKGELYDPRFAARVGEVDSLDLLATRYREAGTRELLDMLLYADVTMYLPDTLLPKVDLATMAHGLEARSPFLDHEVMEFAARLPVDLKLRGTTGKWLLRRALARRLPPAIRRRPKRGFDLPVDRWLRGELRPLAHDLLLGRRALERGYFREDVLRRMLREHHDGRWNWHKQIWCLMMLELWHRTWVDAPATSAPAPRAATPVSARR